VSRRATTMRDLLGQLRDRWQTLWAHKQFRIGFRVVIAALAILLPFIFAPGDTFLFDLVETVAYVVMALGLNVVVGFAGLLDLGYVAFFAIGAYTIGWLGSGFFAYINHSKGVHILVSGYPATLPGIHMNFILVLIAAAGFAALAGAIIGLPTLRLRGDYIAIVTLAFGEIIHDVAVNGVNIHLGHSATLTLGRQGITPIDPPQLVPGTSQFSPLNLRPWYWVALAMVAIVLVVNVRLRDSRLGRAWIALREDEVAAASMGVPLVKTKLLAYATGAAFGGMAGAFLGSYLNTVNADQFEFSFSIFILAMIILGGIASIRGVVVGAIVLGLINTWLIPQVINNLPSKIGLNFDLTQLSYGIFGFLLVIMMVLRPQGLLPERRRQMELVEHVGTGGDLFAEQA
jgi:branched-chain amino acid transport system permease protein